MSVAVLCGRNDELERVHFWWCHDSLVVIVSDFGPSHWDSIPSHGTSKDANYAKYICDITVAPNPGARLARLGIWPLLHMCMCVPNEDVITPFIIGLA